VISYEQLPPILLDQIRHFFAHYKDLEPGKWARIGQWRGPEAAAESIAAAIRREAEAGT
jgi:inorganic pyrophosphatase